jgi:hypothetical protein
MDLFILLIAYSSVELMMFGMSRYRRLGGVLQCALFLDILATVTLGQGGERFSAPEAPEVRAFQGPLSRKRGFLTLGKRLEPPPFFTTSLNVTFHWQPGVLVRGTQFSALRCVNLVVTSQAPGVSKRRWCGSQARGLVQGHQALHNRMHTSRAHTHPHTVT